MTERDILVDYPFLPGKDQEGKKTCERGWREKKGEKERETINKLSSRNVQEGGGRW